MKKFRGKKRYFKKMWSIVENNQLDIDDDSWFDLSHRHLDFYGLGNDSLKIRREHIKAHVNLYSRYVKQLQSFKKPYQTWICIHDEDSGADAVYVHSPNPNCSNFPLHFGFINWQCDIPNTFRDLIDVDLYNVGYYETEIEKVYYIQSKSFGIPLS